jgi:hypothetical protein
MRIQFKRERSFYMSLLELVKAAWENQVYSEIHDDIYISDWRRDYLRFVLKTKVKGSVRLEVTAWYKSKPWTERPEEKDVPKWLSDSV